MKNTIRAKGFGFAVRRGLIDIGRNYRLNIWAVELHWTCPWLTIGGEPAMAQHNQTDAPMYCDMRGGGLFGNDSALVGCCAELCDGICRHIRRYGDNRLDRVCVGMAWREAGTSVATTLICRI